MGKERGELNKREVERHLVIPNSRGGRKKVDSNVWVTTGKGGGFGGAGGGKLAKSQSLRGRGTSLKEGAVGGGRGKGGGGEYSWV